MSRSTQVPIATHAAREEGRALGPWLRLAPPILLAAGCMGLFGLLLARFPYDGLYGQDGYAYYHQSLALLRDMTGEPPPPEARFSADALRWPVGYHLNIIVGILLDGGPEGGRAITMLLAALTPALVYLMVGQVWPSSLVLARVAAGLVAGAALPLTGTYTRMGLSLMADVPALFWSTLAVYCLLRAWTPFPLEGQLPGRTKLLWPALMGLALGLAVLVRYGSILLVVPIAAYLFMLHRTNQGAATEGVWGKLAWATMGFALGIAPQLAYFATHTVGTAYGVWLSDWNPSNIFSTTLTSSDGTVRVEHPNAAFYFVQPLVHADGGFLSRFYLPLFLFGVYKLAAGRSWAILALLAGWWMVPAFFFSGSPYQAHRFVLFYLPALAIPIGIGAGAAVELLARACHAPRRTRFAASLLVLALSLALVVGALEGWRSVRGWVAAHAGWKAQEQQLISLVRLAAQSTGSEGSPRVVSFGTTAALYHYTRWPMRDFFNSDEQEIARFLDAPGSRLLVLPEAQMQTQWAGQPPAARWDWLRRSYDLRLVGRSGEFSVYIIGDRR